MWHYLNMIVIRDGLECRTISVPKYIRERFKKYSEDASAYGDLALMLLSRKIISYDPQSDGVVICPDIYERQDYIEYKQKHNNLL